MSKLTIYGTPASRTYRVLWMANELGLDYENDPVNFRKGEHKTPAYREINPNCRIPAIRDDKVTLCESLAINLYLAKRHGGPMAPASLEEDALATQWSMWTLTEAEPHVVAILFNTLVYPEPQRDPEAVQRATEALKAPLAVLNEALAGREYLIADRFTVADLNVCSVASTTRRLDYDLGPYPNVTAWFDRCLARPAAKAADEARSKAA